MPRRASREAGFIVTLEMIIIFTILGIGLLAGIFAVRNALFVWLIKQQAQTVWVYDANGIPLGPARDFDEHEAPRLFYIDRELKAPEAGTNPDPDWIGHNYRAMIGVRDDRFTTRPRLFYTDLGCAGTPCIPDVSNEDADNLGIGILSVNVETMSGAYSSTSRLQNAGGVGYLYALQHGPNYAIGADVDQTFSGYRLPGTLYRQTADSCTDPVRSVWTSQEVVSGEPCLNLPDGLVIESAKCPSGQGGDDPGDPCNVSPNVDPRCVTGGYCAGGSNVGLACYLNSHCPASTCTIAGNPACVCPVGWSAETGANCCPPGSTETAPGQCEIATDGIFFEAEAVEFLGGGNVFANLNPEFYVNLPPDPADFRSIEPTAEGAGPGADAGPYTGTDFTFDRAPDGE